MKKIISGLMLVLSLVITGACMPLQVMDKYEPETLDIYTHVTSWEYIQTRSDILGAYIEAVNLCGIKDYFTQTTTQYTFLPLTDAAIADDLAAAKADASKIPALKEILLFHIVKGCWYGGYGGPLTYKPVYVETLLGGSSLMSMCLEKNIDWDASYMDRLQLMTNCGASEIVFAINCNHICTNGACHILDTKCVYVE